MPLTTFDADRLALLLKKENLLLLDSRAATTFTLGFIPGSINIGLEGKFEYWAKQLIPTDKAIVIIADEGKEKETEERLTSAGLDNIRGYLKGGFEAWQKDGRRTDMIIDVTAEELALDMPFDEKLSVIDVRKESEYEEGHIVGAELLPLESIIEPLQIAQLDDESNMYVHCGGGYRSVIACSIMKKEGFHNVRNVLGGFKVIKETAKIPLEGKPKSN